MLINIQKEKKMKDKNKTQSDKKQGKEENLPGVIPLGELVKIGGIEKPPEDDQESKLTPRHTERINPEF